MINDSEEEGFFSRKGTTYPPFSDVNIATYTMGSPHWTFLKLIGRGVKSLL